MLHEPFDECDKVAAQDGDSTIGPAQDGEAPPPGSGRGRAPAS